MTIDAVLRRRRAEAARAWEELTRKLTQHQIGVPDEFLTKLKRLVDDPFSGVTADTALVACQREAAYQERKKQRDVSA